MALVIGREVTIGRTEGTLNVASSALSRKHASVARDGGRVVVKDLGSRNGTHLRGFDIPPELDVGSGVSLTLGGAVPLHLSPSTALPGGIAIEVAGEHYIAPLGEARLGVGNWYVSTTPDGWIELVSDGGPPVFTGAMLLAPRITLLRGDAFSCERLGEAVLWIEE
jgi:hypothetical protein